MSTLYKNYEVSIWNYVEAQKAKPDTDPPEYYTIFEESKLAVIGASDMTALSRCVQPNLTLRANGNNTFSFVLYTKYYDMGEKVDNPFVNLMYNGRRVKVRVEDEWYDFVISDIQESSDNKSITYSCIDAFNYELGKSGYELEFAEELETQGSTTELAEKILAGTAWEIDDTKNEPIRQYKYEQLVEYSSLNQVQFKEVLDETHKRTLDPFVQPPEQEGYCYWYGFYSQMAGDDHTKDQFIIYENGRQIGSDAPVSLDRLEYTLYYYEVAPTNIVTGDPIAVKANRLVDTYDSNIDPIIDKYYTTYTKNDHEYRIYSDVEYKKPYTLTNYIDVSGFMGYKYKVGADTSEASKVRVDYDPALTTQTLLETNRQKYYEWSNEDNSGSMFYGINSLKNKIDFTAEGKKLVVEVTYLNPTTLQSSDRIGGVRIVDFKKEWNNQTDWMNDFYMEGGGSSFSDDNLVQYFILVPSKTTTAEQFLQLANLKLELIFLHAQDSNVKITGIRLFDYILKENDRLGFYLPEDLMTAAVIQDIEPITYYYVYDPEQSPAYTSLDDLVIIEKTTDISSYSPKSRDFIKIRSITGKQSNRFNLLQTICERFECWLHFSFERDPNGKVTSKKIYFTDTQGKQVHYGFISGINLKNSQRTLKSENLTTRLIVSPNANEFAEGGSCNISLSQWNYTKENALYNFDYYLGKGAIDKQIWLNDFYDDSNGWFVQLHNLNENREELITDITELSSSLNKAKADLDLAKAGINAATDERQQYDDYIYGRAGASHDKIIQIFRKENPTSTEEELKEFWSSLLDDSKFNYYWVKYEEANNNCNDYESLLNTTQTLYDALEAKITQDYEDLVDLNTNKQVVYDEIYRKYYPFIAEGSWINEDYFDNDLYYVDAETTLYTSAYPEVSYSLSVVDLESLDDFKAYKFIPGDISFVQDVDFFGWEEDGITPHKLKVWISEKKISLDDPSSTTITVQNYANDFDSLFQKITAATQTLQYKEGVYNRSGKIVNGNGQVEYQAIANTLKIAPISLENLGAQSVTVGEDGITVTSLLQPSHKVRIIGDGIYISDNGGNEYFPVITGAGTNLSKLTAGQIDTTNINIVDGSFNMFRWDETGINAYWYEDIGDVKTYNVNKFVRLDRFGLYGYHHEAQAGEPTIIFKPDCIEKIVGYRDPDHPEYDNTDVKFSLTWQGLNFRSENGYIRFDSEENRLTIGSGENQMVLGELEDGRFGFSIGDIGNIPQLNELNNNFISLNNTVIGTEENPGLVSDVEDLNKEIYGDDGTGTTDGLKYEINNHAEEQAKWITYDTTNGLVLGANTAAGVITTMTQITHEGLFFRDKSGDAKAYINLVPNTDDEYKFYIDNGQIVRTLLFGSDSRTSKWSVIPTEAGHLTFKGVS